MISREEWLAIPLEARLTEQANHTEDELLRDDLILAIARIDTLTALVDAQRVEIVRLERVAATPTPY